MAIVHEREIPGILENLNTLFAVNPAAVKALFAVRVPFPGRNYRDDCLSVKALLNEAIGMDGDGESRIAANEDEQTREVLGFCRYRKPESAYVVVKEWGDTPAGALLIKGAQGIKGQDGSPRWTTPYGVHNAFSAKDMVKLQQSGFAKPLTDILSPHLT